MSIYRRTTLNTHTTLLPLGLAAALCSLQGCSSTCEVCNGGEHEARVALRDVPERYRHAAMNAVPGITLTGAEIELEHGDIVYEFEGSKEGVRYEIEVVEDGDGLEVEVERGDEDDEN